MTDPHRLRAGGDDPVVASLLDAARAYRRPVASRNRILKMLGLPVAISVGLPAAAIASSFGTKVVLIVSTATAVVAGGSAVAYRAYVRARAQEVASMASHRVVAPRAPQQREAVPVPTEQPVAPALGDPPAPVVPSPPGAAAAPARLGPGHAAPARKQSPVRPSHLSVALVRNEPPLAPAAVSEPAQIAPSTPTAPPAVSLSTPDPATHSAFPHPPPATAAPESPPRRAPLAREIALLDAAERAEREHDYRSALAQLQAYSRDFPDGALLAEAEVLRISALFGAGDRAAARTRARAFLAGSAPSPLTARVAAMLSRESDKKEQP